MLGAWALMLVVFVLLAQQMRAGHDPALGAAAPAVRARPVVVRRVQRRTVVVPAPAPAPVTTRSS